MKSLHIHAAIIMSLTLLTFWLRFANLDTINLFNDEYYQFETAVSVLETGEYKRYNFYTNQPVEDYTRAKPYTWQIAQSLKLFGQNEVAARLPAVLWGTLLIPVMILVLLRVGQSPVVAYGTGVLLMWDDFFIAMSRFTRMYSMVFVLTIVILWLLYEAMQATTKKWQLVWLGIAAAIGLLLYAIFAELAMLLGAGVGVYVAVRAVAYLGTQDQQHQLYGWLFGGGVLLAIIGALLHTTVWPFIPTDAFGLRIQPHLFYIEELFAELKQPFIAVTLFLCGILGMKRLSDFQVFGLIVALPILIFFVYFGQRWEATRYIGFIIPLFYIVIVSGAHHLSSWLTQLQPSLKQWQTAAGMGVVLLGLAWWSVPGLPAVPGVVQTAYADRGYEEIQRPNMQEAYQYVIDQYELGQIVFMQGPRYFYWTDTSIPVQELGAYKSLTTEEFLEMMYSAEHGGIVVYNRNKARHLNDEIKQFIEANMELDEAIYDTKVNVYYFTPDMLP